MTEKIITICFHTKHKDLSHVSFLISSRDPDNTIIPALVAHHDTRLSQLTQFKRAKRLLAALR